jgi:predicted metal-binding membrane protein
MESATIRRAPPLPGLIQLGLAFLMRHWRSGRWGGLRMDIVHGGWCVGCCCALMAALFALGVMSLGWMVLIVALTDSSMKAMP